MLRKRLSAIATAVAVVGAMVIGVPAAHAEEADTTPPTITVISPGQNQQIPIGVMPTPTVQFECDDDVAVKTCTAVVGRVDAQAPPITSGNGMPLDVTWTGQYFLRVSSTDTAGNPAESVVLFEMVGEGPEDTTPPTIDIAAPVDGSQVKRGASLTATYLCQDSGSGIDSCDGTVDSGQAVDTSTLGNKEFTVTARDKAGNNTSKTVTYEVIAPASVTISGTIKDEQGNLLPGSTVHAYLVGTNDEVASTQANSEGVYALTLPEGTYDLRYRGPAGSGIGANLENRDLTQNTELPVTLGRAAVTLSGTVSDGLGGVVTSGWVSVSSGGSSRGVSIGSDGSFSVEVLPGTVSFSVQVYGSASGATFSMTRAGREFTEDAVVDFAPDLRPVTVHVVDAAGQGVQAAVALSCGRFDFGTGEGLNTYHFQRGPGQVQVYGMPTQPSGSCELRVTPEQGPETVRRIEVGDEGSAFTVFTFGTGIVIDGGTDATNDGDNVADAVEALAPNEGDGNNDGTPDYEQENVTSLPVNGGSFGSDERYVTVEAPDGTELTNVYTIDPTDTTKVETPPPPGVTLPEGLTNLVLNGVEEGTDQTLSIYTASTQDVTGYAKYDPNTKQWSLLPDDRVQVFDDRVEITLTDGGIGDDDGEANGQISDPGGIAIVENLDTVAPAVTGVTTSQPNANGWYNDDVTVEWTATDPEPSSGLASQPANTVVKGEGDDLTAESGQVCDNAGNCSTGNVDSIKIDRTRPAIEVAGVADGETYTLGAVPTATCSASDVLSGVDGECTVTLTGGNANGVGEFTYEATARDKAGNVRTETLTYRVAYRFDGFLPPVNDPVFTSWDFRSVFRSGWPVPALFQLKKANGSAVQPVSAPEWLTPQKGKAINAPVNEEQPEEAISSGKTYTKILGVWTYVWNTRGIERGYEYRIGVKLDDGTRHYVTVAVK